MSVFYELLWNIEADRTLLNSFAVTSTTLGLNPNKYIIEKEVYRTISIINIDASIRSGRI